jgi:hypothetical protein
MIVADASHRNAEAATIFGQELLKQRRGQQGRVVLGLGTKPHNPVDASVTVQTTVEEHD